jgi:hypothetical protein
MSIPLKPQSTLQISSLTWSDFLVPTCTTSGGKQSHIPIEFGVRWELVPKDGLVQVIEELLCVFFSILLFYGRSRL